MIDVIIAGAQKAGTTSLKYYLGQHPFILTHPQIEMTYFHNHEEYEKGADWLRLNYRIEATSDKINLAKHATLARKEVAISRLFDHNPDCKIIFIVRDPMVRIFSSYFMEKKNGNITENFDEVVKIALSNKDHWYHNVLLKLSCYTEQLDTIEKYFQRDSLRILKFEDFIQEPGPATKDLYKWLGLVEYSPNIEKLNGSEERPVNSLGDVLNLPFWLKLKVKRVMGGIATHRLNKFFSTSSRKTIPLERLTDYQVCDEYKQLLDFFQPYNDRLKSEWSISYGS